MKFVGEGCQRVRDKVGKGHLVGKVVVDQIYARYQHERMDLRHPRGGQAKYLWLALTVGRDQDLEELAKSILETSPVEGMKKVVESIDRKLHRFAPVWHDNLRESGNPQVFDGGSKVYDRPARQPRMTEEQLKAARRRGAGGLGAIT